MQLQHAKMGVSQNGALHGAQPSVRKTRFLGLIFGGTTSGVGLKRFEATTPILRHPFADLRLEGGKLRFCFPNLRLAHQLGKPDMGR